MVMVMVVMATVMVMVVPYRGITTNPFRRSWSRIVSDTVGNDDDVMDVLSS